MFTRNLRVGHADKTPGNIRTVYGNILQTGNAELPSQRLLLGAPTARCYNHPMQYAYYKAARRTILETLYETYRADPLGTLPPEDLLEKTDLSKEDLAFNCHYLADRGLIELVLGYSPPLFSLARIRPLGIDLVENPFALNREFPPAMDHHEAQAAQLPVLLEKLVAEVDLAHVCGVERARMLRDVQYLRDEIAQRPSAWRMELVNRVSDWIEAGTDDVNALPSLVELKSLVVRLSGADDE